MSPLGKRIIILLMCWVLLVMVVLQVYDNVTGKGMPARVEASVPAAEPTVAPDPAIQRLADLQTCVAANPSNLQCTLDLALFYYQAGQYPQAQVNYESAAKLSPGDYQILLKLAGTYIFQQKFPQAAATLTEAARLKPDSPEIHLLLGLALSRLDPPKINEALAEWRQVVTLAPGTKFAEQATQYINESSSR
ncbi:MAG: tetratricopeptide repeat protein [Chloroflexota bacterium]